jgi:hypothetical protein
VKVKLTKGMFRVLNVLNSSSESASLNDTSIENTNLDRNSAFTKKIVMWLKWQLFISVLVKFGIIYSKYESKKS